MLGFGGFVKNLGIFYESWWDLGDFDYHAGIGRLKQFCWKFIKIRCATRGILAQKCLTSIPKLSKNFHFLRHFTFKIIRNSPIQCTLQKARCPPDSTILLLEFKNFSGLTPPNPLRWRTLLGAACLWPMLLGAACLWPMLRLLPPIPFFLFVMLSFSSNDREIRE